MIGGKHSEAIRMLQADTATHSVQLATLSAQVDISSAWFATLSALSAQVAALSSQLAAQLEHAAAEAARIAQLERRMAETEQIVAAQAEALQAQAAEIDLFRQQSERQDETTRQIQGGFARIERQATIDLEEMRRTSAAMAQAALLGRFGSTATPDGDRVGR